LNNPRICRKQQTMDTIMKCSQSLLSHHQLFGSNTLLSTLFSNALNQHSSRNVRSSTETRGKVTRFAYFKLYQFRTETENITNANMHSPALNAAFFRNAILIYCCHSQLSGFFHISRIFISYGKQYFLKSNSKNYIVF
jgi:hypothetical protein